MEASLHSNVQTRQDIARDIIRDWIISRYGCVRVVYLRAEHGRGLWWTYPWIFNSAPKCCWANRDVVQKKEYCFQEFSVAWHGVVLSFLSQFRRLALQARDELKSKSRWNAMKGLRWANLLPMKRVRLTSGVCMYFHPVTGPFMKYKTWMFEWMEAHFRSWVRHGILYIYWYSTYYSSHPRCLYVLAPCDRGPVWPSADKPWAQFAATAPACLVACPWNLVSKQFHIESWIDL